MADDAIDPFKSGNDQVDVGVRKALERMCQIFRLEGNWRPDFKFYDDGDIGNASAGPPVMGLTHIRVLPYVRIGRKLVAETSVVTSGDFGAALTGVFAHEFAHIYQMKAGYRETLNRADSRASSRLVEMHADFLAGWALPQSWWITKVSDLGSASRQFYELGDKTFEAAQHHGSSLQRQTIMAAGYAWGLTNPDNPDSAAERGVLVLRDVFPTWFRDN